MGDHIGGGMLPAGGKVEFTPVNPGAGRSEKGARRVRRFYEQQELGVDGNGVPKPNKSTGTRPVSPEKWKKYTINGNLDFNDPYFN